MDESASTAVQSPPAGQQPAATASTQQQQPQIDNAATQPQNGTDRDSVSPPSQSVPPTIQNSAKLYEEGAAAAAAAAGLTSLGKILKV